LHPRDNLTLLDTLDRLRAKGNTLVVVDTRMKTPFAAPIMSLIWVPGREPRGDAWSRKALHSNRPRLTRDRPMSRSAAEAFSISAPAALIPIRP